MKALRWHARDDIRLDDVEDPPPPGPDDISIDVAWCGICGTDVEEWKFGPLVTSLEPHPITGACAPLTMGHEVSGIVTAVGDRVADKQVGDVVSLDGIYFCGTCPPCLRHDVHLCTVEAFIGMSAPGGLAERMTIPARMAMTAPPGTPADAMALGEPVSVAVRSLRRGRLQQGDRVLVFGAGAIGLSITQVALASGASEVTVVDPSPQRRQRAAAAGAAVVLDPADDLRSAILDVHGLGADVVLDATGRADVVRTALAACRKGGRVVLVGLPPEPTTLNLLGLVLREVELIGTVGHIYDEDFARAIDLIATGAVDAAGLITHRLPLERALDGFELLASGAPDAVKVLIGPGA